MLAGSGAVGGAILSAVSEIGVEIYKHGETAEQHAFEVLNNLNTAYKRLGEKPGRAAAFIDGLGEGDIKDVGAIADYFNDVIREARLGEVSKEKLALNFGGRLLEWSDRFASLADGESSASISFSPASKRAFASMGLALADISRAARDSANPDAVDNYLRDGGATVGNVVDNSY